MDISPFGGEEVRLPNSHPACPAAFREQILELVRAGRTPGEPTREFEPTAQTIRNWVAQAARDRGERPDGLSTTEQHQLRKLRREVRQLTDAVQASHARSDGTYGAPRILADLQAAGERVSQKRVARLMREAGVVGVHRRRGVRTTRRGPEATAATDLVQRDFMVTAPNELWVADITCVPTWAGFLYLAVVLDAFSRRVVGWAIATSRRSDGPPRHQRGTGRLVLLHVSRLDRDVHPPH